MKRKVYSELLKKMSKRAHLDARLVELGYNPNDLDFKSIGNEKLKKRLHELVVQKQQETEEDVVMVAEAEALKQKKRAHKKAQRQRKKAKNLDNEEPDDEAANETDESALEHVFRNNIVERLK
jgi:hypothetical protein